MKLIKMVKLKVMMLIKIFSLLLVLFLIAACSEWSSPYLAIQQVSHQADKQDLELEQSEKGEPLYFNQYILKAIHFIDQEYGLLGYNIKAILTHDIPYKNDVIKRTYNGQTMCVAAVLEIILTAMHIYAEEHNDYSVFEFLPQRSWKKLNYRDIKAHIWVNYKIPSYGTAHALENFGMGKLMEFKDLKPGAFINFNRTNKTGHAVVFMGFIDINGDVLNEYSDQVRGFKYYSAQGSKNVGQGGFSYRYAFFNQHGCPSVTGNKKRDCYIYDVKNFKDSKKQIYLNTGMMFSPSYWQKLNVNPTSAMSSTLPDTVFDGNYFNGVTIDD